MTIWIRSLPIVFAGLLCGLTIWLWPEGRIQDVPLLAWVNMSLLIVISISLSIYGIYLLRQISAPPGSRLRAKLVLGLVGMLLIPAGTLQLAANQMVEKGMNTWFDMRVDTLLDRALNLAQGFYSRIDQDLQRNLQQYSQDDLLIADVAGLPISYRDLNQKLNTIIHHEGWHSLQVYDRNERLIAALQLEGLANMKAETWSEQARLSFALGKVSSELVRHGQEEEMIAYAPIFIQNHAVALIKATVTLPHDLIQHARAVESDYRTYRTLERDRQSIRKTFTQSMLLITLIVVIAVGLVAIVFSRRLTRPIGQLARALEQVTQGDFNVHIPQAPDDDLGVLVKSFNRMALRMKQNIEALEHVQHDLTQALNSSRQRQYVLETLLGNLQSGVILMNHQSEIRLINQSFRKLFSLSEKDWLAGKDFTNLALHHLPMIADFYSELHHQQPHRLQRELEWINKGKTHHILARGERLETSGSAGFTGYLLLFDDVTALADAQKHRAWAEVAQRLAHEIKNPLTPIKLAAERLQRRFRQQVEPTDIFDRCTGAIITQTERLQRLISDFSTLARLPEPHCKPTACNTLLEEMRDLYSAYPRVHIETNVMSFQANCDADQIRQVLINLMENALAATAEHHESIHFYLKHEGQFIAFHIEDLGQGIPDIHQAHLFDAYYSTKAEGSGLGLSIAKRIADEHAGDLLLISPQNPTHFCLYLPAQSEQTQLFEEAEKT
ncbi:MAG: HAMP domain-containing protein [Zetaproteobacteria bacterium]|nr:HAMP domain-containing protein [Zetaproteobacteria bacterium]